MTKKRDLKQAFFTKEAAELAGVSQREAQYVLNRMDRKNEKVVTAVMLLKEGYARLVREVSSILPEIDTAPAPNDAFCPRNEQ